MYQVAIVMFWSETGDVTIIIVIVWFVVRRVDAMSVGSARVWHSFFVIVEQVFVYPVCNMYYGSVLLLHQ